MKKLLTTILALIILSSSAQQKTLFLNIGSHNEIQDANPTYGVNYNDQTIYDSVKARLNHILDTIVNYGAKYNMQVESNFILACLNWDNAASSSTDFIETMENHPNVEVDPHNHLDLNFGTSYNPYNYADLDSLLRSCGLDTSSIVGGFIFKQSDWTYPTSEDWTTWKTSGLNGNTFTSVNWKPRSLWGGGTGNHQNDPFSTGIWHPAAASNTGTYLADATGNLYSIGVGCEWVVQDTTNVTRLFGDIVDHINYFQMQPLTGNTFYTGTVMFNFKHILKPQYVDSISKMIRLIDAYETTGEVAWLTLDEKLDLWEQLHPSAADYYVRACANMPGVGMQEVEELQGISIFPNPSNGVLNIKNESNEEIEITIYNSIGQLLCTHKVKPALNSYSIELKNKGCVTAIIKQGNTIAVKKVIVVD